MSGRRLSVALAEYLAVRRALGFKLSTEEPLLEQFVGFCEQADESRVTSELALAWVSAPAKASPGRLEVRLTAVRGFASWLQAGDPATEVPPLGWLPPRRRTTPYLYSADDIAAVVAVARRVKRPLAAATHETLFALLALTGMRVGEAIRLDHSDLSIVEGLLTISNSKFGKSRQLLLHPSTVSALSSYLRRCNELSSAPGEPALFVNAAGRRLNYPVVAHQFRRSGGPSRAERALAALSTDDPRAEALLRSEYDHPLVSGGRRCPGSTGPAVHLARPCGPEVELLVPVRFAGVVRPCRGAPGDVVRGAAMSAIAPTLQEFFTIRLIGQRQASPHTVAAYRDCFRLLFAYVAATTAKQPAELDFADLDAGTINGFLAHLENDRGVSVATRNARLVALHSLFSYAAYRHPEHAALIARVLAIPAKRGSRPLVSFLEREEVEALLRAPETDRWAGRRDHALLTFAVQTGLRVSELTGVCNTDLSLGRGAHVQVMGKGRKERAVPLSRHTVAALRPHG